MQLQNDLAEWEEVQQSFVSMERTPEETDAIFSIISGILALGNVNIIGGDQSQIDPSTRHSFDDACTLMYLDSKKVEEGITTKISTAGTVTVDARRDVAMMK